MVHWGYTGGVPKCHDVPMAPLDSFIQLGTTEAREPILPEYAFALCIPCSWPFPNSMDKTILLETYFSEGDLGGEDTNAMTPAKKTRKRKGKKTQKRSKITGTTSSTSKALPRLAWLEPRQTLQPMRNVPNRSCKNCIFRPKVRL